ncbi:MAG TPA: hypothetical protein VOB72_01310 [Candidatus Dormibacteraeota bacterium]|nr:hypothetical protein [Candidatus Dormibacteraeota bacterium]
MDLRLVEYGLYLAAAVPLTLWAGRTLHRAVWLVGLGGVALLLQVDGSLAGAADVVRVVALKVGLLLLLLGGLHLGTLLVQRRMRETARPRPAAEYEPLRPASGRFPY